MTSNTATPELPALPVPVALSDEQCDKAAAQTMDRVAKARDIHALDLNPDITAHHTLRRELIRTGFALSHPVGAGVAEPKPAPPTLAQLDSACLSYRHDFGLMDEEEQERLRWSAKQWLRAWGKEVASVDQATAPVTLPDAAGQGSDDARDAKRYRWLRSVANSYRVVPRVARLRQGSVDELTGAEMDAAIDVHLPAAPKEQP